MHANPVKIPAKIASRNLETYLETLFTASLEVVIYPNPKRREYRLRLIRREKDEDKNIFTQLTLEKVRIQLGKTTPLGEITLEPGAIEMKEVVVTVSKPLIDPASTMIGADLDINTMEMLPVEAKPFSGSGKSFVQSRKMVLLK